MNTQKTRRPLYLTEEFTALATEKAMLNALIKLAEDNFTYEEGYDPKEEIFSEDLPPVHGRISGSAVQLFLNEFKAKVADIQLQLDGFAMTRRRNDEHQPKKAPAGPQQGNQPKNKGHGGQKPGGTVTPLRPTSK
jgi:hypothetical protein